MKLCKRISCKCSTTILTYRSKIRDVEICLESLQFIKKRRVHWLSLTFGQCFFTSPSAEVGIHLDKLAAARKRAAAYYALELDWIKRQQFSSLEHSWISSVLGVMYLQFTHDLVVSTYEHLRRVYTKSV